MVIAFIKHETVPKIGYILAAMLLGFVAYGLSIFMYVGDGKMVHAANPRREVVLDSLRMSSVVFYVRPY